MSVKAFGSTILTAVAQCLTDDETSKLIPTEITKEFTDFGDKHIPGFSIATTVIKGLTKALAPELMGSFIEKIEYEKIKQTLQNPSPNQLNHDLEKLIKSSALMALGHIERLYVDKLNAENEDSFLKKRFNKSEEIKEIEALFEQLKKDLTDLFKHEPIKDSILEDPSHCLNDITTYIFTTSRVNIDSEFAQFFTEKLPFCFDLAYKQALKDDKNETGFKAFQIWILENINEKISYGNDKILAEIQHLKNQKNTFSSQKFKKYLEDECVALHLRFDEMFVVLGEIKEGIGDLKKGQEEIKEILINGIAPLPKELSLKIPKIHPNEVIGRENELADLHQLLFDNKQVVVVNGLGGIGKTTLAQAYLSQYYDDYQHIVWISQSSESSIKNDFVNTEGLKENLKIITEGKDFTTLFNELLLALKALPDKPNLLLIDNAEASLTEIFDKLPHQPNWHLLATSRENIERFYMKELGFLTPEKALELFRTHCKLIHDEAAIKDLLKTIDYHTLTIEILAKTAQQQHTGIISLKTAIENDLKSPIFVKHKGEKIDKVRSYLCSIFDLSKLNPHEVWLMKQFMCLPADFISYALLLELIAPEGEQQENFAETLANLVAKGWILTNSDTDSYKMHRIIADVSTIKLPIILSDVENLINSIKEKLNTDQTKDNPIDQFQWIPFGNAILNHFDDSMNNIIVALQNNLALALKDLGDFYGAKKLLEKVIISDENNFGENHSSTALSYSNLAMVLQDLGDYKEAQKLLEKAVISDENNFGEMHKTTMGRYSNLAVNLFLLGDYTRAKKLLEKTVIFNENNFGEEHPDTARTYSNLAVVLQELGDFEGAKKLSEKAVISDEKNFGEEHPTTAKAYSNLALVLRNLGDYEGAKILLEKAVISYEKNFGEEHPDTARTYSNLAATIQNLSNYQAAKILLEKAVISYEKIFGEEHPDTARTYSNLATVFIDLGDYVEAKKLFEKAYKIYRNILGEQHPTTKIIKENLDFAKEQMK